jgi:regulator of sigma E protease
MMETPGFFWTVLMFVLALSPLVFVHEMGHYLVGRWCGVKAETFSVGFGRSLINWTDARGTIWQIGWLPLGGYVRFAGDMSPVSEPNDAWRALPEAERNRTFQSKALWQRAAIVFAGPATNFLFAILILAGFALVNGRGETPPVAQIVESGSPAEKSGIQPGDRVVAINGRTISVFDEIPPFIEDRPGAKLEIDLMRNGQARRISVVAATRVEKDRFGNEYRFGRIGIGNKEPVVVPVTVLEAPAVAASQTVEIVDRMIGGLWQIITGRRPVAELGGPIKIAQISGQVATLGWASFVHLLALISINLGFINLLPVPILDGGHLTFYAIEAIRRKPVSPRAVEWAFRSGLAMMLGLMIFVTLNDLASLGLWGRISRIFG